LNLNDNTKILVAQSYNKLGMKKYSKTIYEEVLKNSPNNISALNNLSIIEENYKKAMDYLMKIEKICPDNVEFKCNSAVLMIKNGNSHGASILEELTHKKSINVPSFHFYMDYLIKAQKYSHCEKHLKPFVEAHSNDFVALLLQFNLYSHMNLLDEASKVAQVIISLEHGCENIKNYLAHQIEQFNTRTEAKNEENVIQEGNIKENSLRENVQQEVLSETEPQGPSEYSDVTKSNENPYRRDKSPEHKGENKANSHEETKLKNTLEERVEENKNVNIGESVHETNNAISENEKSEVQKEKIEEKKEENQKAEKEEGQINKAKEEIIEKKKSLSS